MAAAGRQPGWDIEYRSNGQLIAIEVKGATGEEFEAVEITANEWEAAKKQGEDYWLYLVTECDSRAPRITRIQNPYGLYVRGEIKTLPLLWRLERV